MCSHLKAWSIERLVKLKKLRYSSATIRLKSLLGGREKKRKYKERTQRTGKNTTSKKAVIHTLLARFGLSVREPETQTAGRKNKNKRGRGGDSCGACVRGCRNPFIPHSHQRQHAADRARARGAQRGCSTAQPFVGRM